MSINAGDNAVLRVLRVLRYHYGWELPATYPLGKEHL